MLNYKGYKIPETIEETREILDGVPTCPIGPHVVIRNESNTRITTMIPIEAIANGSISMETVIEKCKETVDYWAENGGAE